MKEQSTYLGVIWRRKWIIIATVLVFGAAAGGISKSLKKVYSAQSTLLVVQPLDPQLGKIKDIAAGALMEDGSPVLIVDAEDMIRSMDKLASGERLATVPRGSATANEKKRKRVLVVDDMADVRMLMHRVLARCGYHVDDAGSGLH